MEKTQDAESRLTEAQKEWIAALRSGDYRQHHGALHYIGAGEAPEGFCCLGVACKLFSERLDITVHQVGRFMQYDCRSGHLTEQLVEHLNLLDEVGAPNPLSGRDKSLTKLNDTGTSFNEIADLLETGDYFVPPAEATAC